MGSVRRGAQRPRVCRVPPYVDTLGDEVIDFMREVGKPALPWQEDILRGAFGRRADGKWASYEVTALVARQNGKGVITEAQELFGLFMLREKKIVHSAHLFDTSQEAFKRLCEIIEGSDWLTRRVKSINQAHGKEGITLTRAAGGGELKFKARTKHGTRGFTGDRIILDEAYALTVGQMQAISPILATLPNPQITYTSSPPDEKTGPMPEDAMLPSIRKRGHAGDPRMAFFEWSPDGKRNDIDETDVDLWYACNPSLGYLIDQEFLDSQLRIFAAAGKADAFATEHLGAWEDDEGPQWSVVTEEQYLAAVDVDSTIRGPQVFSVDSTPDRAWTSISVAGKRADGDLHGEVIELRPGMDWAPGRLAELVKKWRPPVVSLVGTGQAYALHPDIVREITALGMLDVVTEVKVMTNREVAAAFGLVVNGLTATDGRRVRVRPGPHGEALADAVRGGVKRDIGEGSAWDRGASSVNVCPVIGMTNAIHTYASAKISPPVGAVNSGATGPAAGNPLRDRGGLRAAAGGNPLRSGGRLGR